MDQVIVDLAKWAVPALLTVIIYLLNRMLNRIDSKFDKQDELHEEHEKRLDQHEVRITKLEDK
jgi:hypothetical protein